MSTSTMAQVNIRMLAETKRAGDATLERVSVTPTQLVRAIWAKLALGTEAFDQIMEALVKSPSPQECPTNDGLRQGDLLIERIDLRQEAFEQACGLDATTYAPLSDEAFESLLVEELAEREYERMVWHDA